MISRNQCPGRPQRAERRAAARYACRGDDVPLLVVSHRRESRWARPRDISASGIGLNVAGPFSPDSLLLLQFTGARPKTPLTLVAHVTHTRAEPDGSWYIGCRFDSLRGDLGDAERAELLTFFLQPLPGDFVEAPLPNGLADKLYTTLPPLIQTLRRRADTSGDDPGADHSLEHLFDLLLIARQRLQLEHLPVSLGELLIDALQTTQLARAGSRRCTTLLPEDELTVLGDRARLAWICASLLVEAAGSGGRCWLAAERAERAGLLRLGSSKLSDATLPTLAELLQDSELTAHSDHRRSEVRRALVRALVEKHGGRVEVRWDAHHAGYEFAVYLPLAA